LLDAIPAERPDIRGLAELVIGDVEAQLDDGVRPLVRSGAEWAHSLRRVAEADLDSAILLTNSKRAHISVVGMLLQMSLEKFAKAAVARHSESEFRKVLRSHKVLRRFFLILDRQSGFLQKIGMKKGEFKLVRPHLLALEAAHPALAHGGPHLEYPWEDVNGVYVPSEHLALVREFSDPKSQALPRVIRFAQALRAHFDDVFK
jgi:hypothetical protein